MGAMRSALTFVAASLLLLGSCPRAFAQAKPGPSNSTSKVATITVTGNTRYPPDQIIAASGISVGQMVSVAQLQAAANRLASLGVFKAVDYRYSSKGDSINLEWLVQPAPTVPVSFDNFPWFSDAEIAVAVRKQVGLFDGQAPTGGAMLGQITTALGHMLASRHIDGIVIHQLIGAPRGGRMIMQFQVQGPPVLVQSLTFGDSLATSSERLKDRVPDIQGKPYSRYALEVFEYEQVRPLYLQNGYLHVRLGEPQTRLLSEKKGSAVAVVIPIVPGPVYTWNEAVWQGNVVVPSSALNDLLGLKPGDVADGMKIQAGWENVEAEYGTHGYLDVKLDPKAQFDESTRRVSYLVKVTEGHQYRMGDMVITGLSVQAEAKLRQDWQLAQGQIFDENYFNRMVTELAKPTKAVFGEIAVNYKQFGHWLQRNTKLHTVTVLLDFK